MRLIVEEQNINFKEKVILEMSLKELLVLYASIASTNSEKVSNWLGKYKMFDSLQNEVKEIDLSYVIYEEINSILNKKGISI